MATTGASGATPSELNEHAHAAHEHPGPGVYLKIGLVLFVLTALEVGAYELAYTHGDTPLGAAIRPIVIPILLILSVFKFALVAMYYMHLKQDGKTLTGLFVFPLIIAAFVVVGLMVFMAYHWAFARSG
jgi:cytochrome c oxidase subunit 4